MFCELRGGFEAIGYRVEFDGFGGYDVNALPVGPEALGLMIRDLWREGVTSCFPTVITNSPQAIGAAMTMIAQSCEHDIVTSQGVAGIHLEGPFISPQDGARG